MQFLVSVKTAPLALSVVLGMFLAARRSGDEHDRTLKAMHDFARSVKPSAIQQFGMILLVRGDDPLSVLPDPVATATGNEDPLVDQYHPVWPHDGGNMAQNFSIAIEDLEKKRSEIGISGSSAGDLCDACHRSLESQHSGEYEIITSRMARMLEAGPSNLPLRAFYLFTYLLPCESCVLQISKTLRSILRSFGYSNLDIYIGYVEEGTKWHRKSRITNIPNPDQNKDTQRLPCTDPKLRGNTYLRKVKLEAPVTCARKR
ncbi:uncharacterized protein LOC122243515 [Penaeus japonicus]|uniref:uncharacterized protein LOC122243515 n=1 Tax=Penaeus japonicus TaxID=27405 RepID=UPI001C715383|nr:uncharacterized protein LOC122243515 [Penaeus japonicus]